MNVTNPIFVINDKNRELKKDEKLTMYDCNFQNLIDKNKSSD